MTSYSAKVPTPFPCCIVEAGCKIILEMIKRDRNIYLYVMKIQCWYIFISESVSLSKKAYTSLRAKQNLTYLLSLSLLVK